MLAAGIVLSRPKQMLCCLKPEQKPCSGAGVLLPGALAVGVAQEELALLRNAARAHGPCHTDDVRTHLRIENRVSDPENLRPWD